MSNLANIIFNDKSLISVIQQGKLAISRLLNIQPISEAQLSIKLNKSPEKIYTLVLGKMKKNSRRITKQNPKKAAIGERPARNQ